MGLGYQDYEISMLFEAAAIVCLIWYVSVVVVCAVGIIQL
jgi:hypothetical protein